LEKVDSWLAIIEPCIIGAVTFDYRVIARRATPDVAISRYKVRSCGAKR